MKYYGANPMSTESWVQLKPSWKMFIIVQEILCCLYSCWLNQIWTCILLQLHFKYSTRSKSGIGLGLLNMAAKKYYDNCSPEIILASDVFVYFGISGSPNITHGLPLWPTGHHSASNWVQPRVSQQQRFWGVPASPRGPVLPELTQHLSVPHIPAGARGWCQQVAAWLLVASLLQLKTKRCNPAWTTVE